MRNLLLLLLLTTAAACAAPGGPGLRVVPDPPRAGQEFRLEIEVRNPTDRPMRLVGPRRTRTEIWQVTMESPEGKYGTLVPPGAFVPLGPKDVVEIPPGGSHRFTVLLSGFVRYGENGGQAPGPGRYTVSVRYEAPAGEESQRLGLTPRELPTRTLQVVIK